MKFEAQEIVKKLEWRYATKVFNPNKKITAEDWSAIEQSLLLSPSSYGLQPWKFLIVENKAIREQLLPLSWGQKQVTEASHFVVFTTLKKISEAYIKHYIKRIAEIRGQNAESLIGYQNMMIKNILETRSLEDVSAWNQRQSYIAMGFMLETAALLNIDTVPMEGIDPKAYDKVLGLENSDYQTVAAVALGYRDENDKYAGAKKVRFEKSSIIQKI
jgi:nitroreductase